MNFRKHHNFFQPYKLANASLVIYKNIEVNTLRQRVEILVTQHWFDSHFLDKEQRQLQTL